MPQILRACLRLWVMWRGICLRKLQQRGFPETWGLLQHSFQKIVTHLSWNVGVSNCLFFCFTVNINQADEFWRKSGRKVSNTVFKTSLDSWIDIWEYIFLLVRICRCKQYWLRVCLSTHILVTTSGPGTLLQLSARTESLTALLMRRGTASRTYLPT